LAVVRVEAAPADSARPV